MANRWRTKSVEQSIADTDEPDTRLRKDLTWLDLVVFGVAVVIGARIIIQVVINTLSASGVVDQRTIQSAENALRTP